MIPLLKTEIPGPRSREILGQARCVEPPCIGEQFPVVWDRADGAVVTDVDGNVFLDFTSGVLVANVGHSHPAHVRSVAEQAGRLMNSYTFMTEPRARLARKLVEITPPELDRAFIVSTGSEAVEAAIKFARKATGRHEVIAFHGAFHGRTFGAMAAGGKSGVKAGFGPALPGFLHASFPYCYRCPHGSTPNECALHGESALERLLETESVGDVAALITEPYQGAAGSIMPPEGWLARISAWCRERGIVFILDEVQSSFGRTGTMFMFEQLGFVPDLMTLGKGLGSGVAVAAVVGRSDIMDAVPPGGMSSTYGGNPLCCAAALESIAIIERERLCERVARLGPSLGERLRALQERHPCIGEVRGLGFVWGLEVVTDPRSRNPDAPRAQRIVNEACRRGLLLIAPIGFHGNVIRLAPPLTMEEDHLWKACEILEAAVEASVA